MSAFRVGTLGEITMAAAEGLMGGDDYPLRFDLKTSERRSPIVLFPCQAIDFYGLRDPQDKMPIPITGILDAQTNGAPATYGLYMAPPVDATRPEEFEDAEVAFIKPGTRIKVTDPEGRLVLVGREGRGISGSWSGSLALSAARDIHALNENRIRQFEKHRILSPFAKEVQAQVAAELAKAELALDAHAWPEFKRRADSAWALALRAYPLVKGTANDVVNGVVFYLFLLLPFSIFVERLIFGSRVLTTRLGATIGVFVAAFLALRFLHPAFEIVPNPWMIFIAFVMGSLSLAVAILIIGKFESGLTEDRAMRTGLREVNLKRSGAMAISFSLALSNLRRRRLRTWMTAATLMFTTFLVIGFVGMVPGVKIQANRTATKATYSGILVRTPAMDPLTPALVAQFEAEPGKISRRSTSFGADSGGTPTITLYGDKKKAEVRALAGFDSGEPTAVRDALAAGRWFRDGERGALIVFPDGPFKVGDSVQILGSRFEVVGLFDSDRLAAVRDLDGDGLLPPDFTLSRDQQAKAQMATAAFRSYSRLDPAVCALMTTDDLLDLNGQVRTVALPAATDDEVQSRLDYLMPRLRMNLYAGMNGSVSQYNAQVGTAGAGLGLVILQLVIAALFVMNTMLASVHERRGEISILSAVGLAPNQIANLFFAESVIYGVLGSVGGYVIAQIMGRISAGIPALAGLTLNFSSTAAVLAAVLVFACVLLSTIYPARVGSRLAGPDSARSLVKAPEGDDWVITFPFTVSEEDRDSLVQSFQEWFRSHEAFSVGVFVSQDVRGEDNRVSARVSLVPFDLGVSQEVSVRMVEAEHVGGAFDLSVSIRRLSGDPRSWQSLNRTFFSQIRRHFLTWQASR